MPRLFVALGLPEPFKAALQGVQSGLQGARWLRPDSLHLTLAFIGDVDDGMQSRIESALGKVKAPAFSMRLRGIGRFPDRGAPRVIWTGASPETGLVSLAGAVRLTLDNEGIECDRRRFQPHVTVARLRKPPPRADLKRYLDTVSPFCTSPAEFRSFSLYSSALSASGARYSVEASYPLA